MTTYRYGRAVANAGRKTKKRKTKRRNPSLLPARGGTTKARKRPTAKKKAAGRKDPKRVRAGKKAAATRKRNAAARSRAAKKAAKTRSKGTTRKATTRKAARKSPYVYRKPGRYRVKAGPQKGKLRKFPRRTKKAAAKRRPAKRRAAPKRKTAKRKSPRKYMLVRYTKGPLKGRTIRRKLSKRRAPKRKAAKRRSPRRYAVSYTKGRLAGRKIRRKYPKKYYRRGYSYYRGGKLIKVKGHSIRSKSARSRTRKRRKSTKRRKSGKLALRKGTFVANPGNGLMAYSVNPGALAMLPTREQLTSVGKATGVVGAGVLGAFAAGKALTGVGAVRQYLGVWTPVAGNVATGLGFWALASMIDHPFLNMAKPYVAVGAGVAALINIARNLIAGGVISPSMASWVMPDAQVTPTAVAAEVPEAAVSGFGQIDVYEAALDGLGGIEDELESELDRLGGVGGMGSDEGIFSGMSAMGAEVEEAFSGMGAYETTNLPTLGAEVEQAFAGGVGAYEQVPLGGGVGAYEEVPLGAEVEEAFSGMGAANPNINSYWSDFQSSLDAQPLMPGFRAAVQNLVRKRIAAGQALDDAFYQKLGRAAAAVAQRRFEGRARRNAGAPGVAPQMARRLPPVTTMAAPRRMAPVQPDRRPAGGAGGIGMKVAPASGIFVEGDNDGIF